MDVFALLVFEPLNVFTFEEFNQYKMSTLPRQREAIFWLFCGLEQWSGQPPGRGPVPVREEFVTGPYHYPGQML